MTAANFDESAAAGSGTESTPTGGSDFRRSSPGWPLGQAPAQTPPAAHRPEKALAMLREHAASLDPDSFVSEVIRVLEGEDEAPTAAKSPGYGYVAHWTASGRPMIRMVEDGGPNCANVKLCRTMLGARFGAWWRNRRIGV